MKNNRLILPLPPSANEYWRYSRGRVHVSTAAKTYRVRCATAALAQRARLIADEPVELSGTIYFRDRRRDLDGALKILLDALEGVCYKNDRQINEIRVTRGIDPKSPRVELTVRPFFGERARGAADNPTCVRCGSTIRVIPLIPDEVWLRIRPSARGLFCLYCIDHICDEVGIAGPVPVQLSYSGTILQSE